MGLAKTLEPVGGLDWSTPLTVERATTTPQCLPTLIPSAAHFKGPRRSTAATDSIALF
jgi:hypothetical protein